MFFQQKRVKQYFFVQRLSQMSYSKRWVPRRASSTPISLLLWQEAGNGRLRDAPLKEKKAPKNKSSCFIHYLLTQCGGRHSLLLQSLAPCAAPCPSPRLSVGLCGCFLAELPCPLSPIDGGWCLDPYEQPAMGVSSLCPKVLWGPWEGGARTSSAGREEQQHGGSAPISVHCCSILT